MERVFIRFIYYKIKCSIFKEKTLSRRKLGVFKISNGKVLSAYGSMFVAYGEVFLHVRRIKFKII